MSMLSSRRPCLRLAIVALGIAGAIRAQTGSVGLSSVRAQVFDNENIGGVYKPAFDDRFASALAVGDFNGDGADDLATGIPYDDGISGNLIPNIGGVVVRYGDLGRGLRTGLASTFPSQQVVDSPDPAEEGDRFGSALAACDFNHDGRDDLAVGIPGEDSAAGAVQIHYGSNSGLPIKGTDFFTQDTPGVPGDAEAGDNFGYALACGDFNDDGFDDLAIGVPSENLGALESRAYGAGMVDLIPGSPTGLAPGSATSLDQDSSGMDGGGEDDDHFGEALAAGDFNGDGRNDLAIGVPGESFDDLDGNGAVHVVFGGATGLSATGNRLFGETSAGGTAEDGDEFGHALAAADFDHDGRDDLAIGIPLEDDEGGPGIDCGKVAVIYGAAGGVDLTRTTFWNQESVNSNDRFGSAVGAADFDADGFADLAAGSPGQQDAGAARAGEITVFMGSSSGVTAARHRGIRMGRDAFPGDPGEVDRNFGGALATGDFDGDGHADLAIGAPYENEGVIDVGQELVLYGSLHSDAFDGDALTPAWLPFAEPSSSLLHFGGARFRGPLGLAVSLSDTHPAHVRHEIPATTNSYRARFYARLWPLIIAPNKYFVLLEGRGGGEVQFRIYVNRGSKQNGIALGARDNSGTEVFAPLLIPVPDGWRAIEVVWQAATPGQSNGRFDLTIDGHFYSMMSDLDNSNSAVDLVRWGAVDSLDAGTHGGFYLDQYESKRFSAIGQLSSLADTPIENPDWPAFQGLFNSEVTFGCDGSNYCPDLPVTRGQMAMFVLKAKEGPGYVAPPCGSSPYVDFGTGNPFCRWIVELTNRGITTGCAPGLYCPEDPITREQAALWLQRAIEGPGNPPSSCLDEPFGDVARDDDFCPYIRYLADEGITQGCGGGNFCPKGLVTRGQMAPLLIEAFDLFVPEL